MRCALVFYFVVTMFVVVHSLSEQCVFRDYFGGTRAICGGYDVDYTFDFIPPISQNISSIDMREQPLKQLPNNAFRNLSRQRSISGIRLQLCQISQVDAGALLNLHNLTFIDLSFNDVNQIDSELFSDTKRIKSVYLDFNKIAVVPNGLFQNLPLLEIVHLNFNRILQVELFSFTNTPALQYIALNNNQIESMNVLFKDKFDNLTHLSLYGNPWRCNCELTPLYEIFRKTHQLLNLYEPECEKPSRFQGRKWSDISRDIFVCSSEDAISTRDSVMTRTEPTTTIEQDDTVPVTVYSGTRNQTFDTGVPQPPSNQNWILYTLLVLELVCVAAVIIGVVFVVRRTLTKSNVLLAAIVNRGSDCTNSGNMDSDPPMLDVQSSAVSETSDSASNMADVDEESMSIHHYETREATIS